MTLQVGLVGSDGVVIASDQLLQQLEAQGSFQVSSQTLTSKFRRGQNGVVGCWAGDKVSELALDYITKLPSTETGESWEDALVGKANEAWQQMKQAALGDHVRKVLVARPTSPQSLWVVDVQEKSFANPVLDKAVTGDIRNSARQLINSVFSEGYAPLPFSKDQLIFTAAHTILMGGRDNPSAVRGLEVAVIPHGEEPRFLRDAEVERLKIRSQELFLYVKAALVSLDEAG